MHYRSTKSEESVWERKTQRGYILTQISLISQIFYSDTIM